MGGELATLDHVKSWPECDGDIKIWADRENMVLACLSCNQRRSLEWCLKTQAPKKWAIYLEKQGAVKHTPLPPLQNEARFRSSLNTSIASIADFFPK